MTAKNIFYILTCISFSVILGAGVYEHVAVWPVAYSAPPKSLTMFQGNYSLAAGSFWMSIHPVTLVLFFISLALNRKSAGRKYIIIPFITYIAILIITFIYFVPELMRLTGTPYADTVDPDLRASGQTWIVLSLIRAGILVMADFILLSGLTQSQAVSNRQ